MGLKMQNKKEKIEYRQNRIGLRKESLRFLIFYDFFPCFNPVLWRCNRQRQKEKEKEMKTSAKKKRRKKL